MRSFVRSLPWFLLLTLLLALPGHAAMMPFQGRIDVVFGQGLIFASVAGAGVANVSSPAPGGAITAFELPAGVFHATGLNFPGVGVIDQIRVTAANGAGSFGPLTPDGGSGVMPLPGMVRLCLLVDCDSGGDQLLLPLDPVGAGGSARVTGAVTITVLGMPWTKGLVTISTPGAVTLVEGFAHGPLSNTGTTARLGGVLELVTPAAVRTSIPGLGDLTGYAILHLEFVPEPASAPLAALGLALLGIGRRRQRTARARRE